MDRRCSLGDCDRKHYGRGYCQRHYTRVRTHGDPETVLSGHRFTEVDPGRRLAERSQVLDDCIVYLGGHAQRSGHRTMSYRGRLVGAHRVAYELAHGPIPAGKVVMHRCDNPPCIKPEHLILGTVADNNRDRDQKGRHRPLRGSKNGSARLTEYQVQDILCALAGGATTHGLARQYGVNQGAIWQIKAGRSWRHVARADTTVEAAS